MGIFSIFKRDKRRYLPGPDEETRRTQEETRKANAELRALERDIQKTELQIELEERLQSLQEIRGGDDSPLGALGLGEAEIQLITILARLFPGLSSGLGAVGDSRVVTHNQLIPKLDSGRLDLFLSQAPRQLIKEAKKLEEHEIFEQIRIRFPDFNELEAAYLANKIKKV